jgi:hypothetical protein
MWVNNKATEDILSSSNTLSSFVADGIARIEIINIQLRLVSAFMKCSY